MFLHVCVIKKKFSILSSELQNLVDDAIHSFALGEENEAENLLLNVLKKDGKNIEALRAISEVSLSLNKLEDAESYCRQALAECSDDLTSLVSLARILVRKGDKEGAEEASAKARILGWKEELNNDQSESF